MSVGFFFCLFFSAGRSARERAKKMYIYQIKKDKPAGESCTFNSVRVKR